MPVEIVFLAGFVSSVISILGNKIANSSLRGIQSYLEVERKLAELSSNIDYVQSALEKVDDEHLAHSNFKSWVVDMAMLCYDVYDIMDDINLDIMKLDRDEQITSSSSSSSLSNEVFCESSWLNTFLSFFNNVRLSKSSSDRKTRLEKVTSSLTKKFNLSNRIDDMTSRIKQIRKHVNEAVEQSSKKQANDTRRKPHLLFRGVHDDDNAVLLPSSPYMQRKKQEIIDKLIKMDHGGITIVGVGGLGKSILSHSIINDDCIRQSFNFINWASASDWNSIDDDIAIHGIPSHNNSTSLPKKKPSSSLLLLDDLRIRGLRHWECLRDELRSRLQHQPTHIIITCRDPAVAIYTESTLYQLKTLTDEDCKIIIDKAIMMDKLIMGNYDRELLECKVKCIARKCGGLSLVADVIGSHLRSKYKEDPKTFKDVISAVEQDDLWGQHVFLQEIFPELGFDAESLPKKLYKFLAYFALFPCGYKFSKNEVKMLWMAEGFIPPAATKTEWTSTPAIDHFDSLVSTSMLQPLQPSSSQAAAEEYQLHTFAHRYAQSIALRCGYFWLNEGRLSSMENNGDVPSDSNSRFIRHFSVCCQKVEETILENIEKVHKKLRTFLLFKVKQYEIKIGPDLNSLFKKLECLRVISLSGSDISKLPTTISNMKHLRYLDVSNTRIARLPIEICDLLGLQVLKLNGCKQLAALPKNFEALINLTCLELNMSRLIELPTHLGRLTKLQTLPLFIVRSSEGKGVSELENMNSLDESLKITKLENIPNKGEAQKAMLHQKLKIKTLILEWTDGEECQDPSKAEAILTGLQPSDRLNKDLIVSNYCGNSFPNWVISLKNIGRINLYNCPNCKVLPHFGLLPLLKELELQGMGSIELVARSTTHLIEYPALEDLKVLGMKKLRAWESLKPGDMHHLLTLQVNDCPRLTTFPNTSHLPFLQTKDFTGCSRLNCFHR